METNGLRPASDNAKLFMKIAQVMGTCRLLKKEGKNTFDKYDFVTADTVAHRIGELLAANGIAFFPSMIGVETNEYTTQKGGTNFRTVAHFQMTFACNESGATYTSLWTGEAIDRSDKSISKAATSAVKYFLLKTFLLSGVDEDDADASSPEVQSRKATQRVPVNVTNGNANGYHEDELWEPRETVKAADTLSKVQLERIQILGVKAYGGEYGANAGKLARFVSNNKKDSLTDLTPMQADTLIAKLEKRIQENAAQGDPEKQPA